MSGLQHCDQNGKGNCSKTFRRLVLTHLNFSTTTEASRFQCTNLSIPAKGEENNLHLLTGWCETNSGWKELVLLYSWTVTTLHGDPLLVPTVKPCFLSGGITQEILTFLGVPAVHQGNALNSVQAQ